MFSRDQLKRAASLTEEDFAQLGNCRRPHNRLGFAYQVAFVRLLGRFPQEQPFELFEELVCFSAAQLGLDAGLIELYRKRQPTISEHQQTITGYLRLSGLRVLINKEMIREAMAAQLVRYLEASFVRDAMRPFDGDDWTDPLFDWCLDRCNNG